MSSFDIFEDFCQTVESLLAIMEMEAQYLKASRPGKLNSLMGQKTELLHKNKALTEQIFDGTLWNSLEKTQQQKINHLVKSVVLKMKENLDLLDLSKRGNKKLLDIFFKKIVTTHQNPSA